MIMKLQEVNNSATRESVKKTLYVVLPERIKKVMQFKKSGSETDELYKPHLWYYKYLLFLTDQETPRQTVTNIDEETNNNQESKTYIFYL